MPEQPQDPQHGLYQARHSEQPGKTPSVRRGNSPARTTASTSGPTPRASIPPIDSPLILPGPTANDYQGNRQMRTERVPYAPLPNIRSTKNSATMVPPNVPSSSFLGLPPETIQILLVVADVLLVVSILVVLSMILYDLTHNSSLVLISPSLLLLELGIYGVCVFSGYLWGRYQVNTLAMQENAQLQATIREQDRQMVELQNSVEQLEAVRDAEARQMQARSVSPPTRKPTPSIYDVFKDPVNFEQEQLQHPHEKMAHLTLLNQWNVLAGSRRGYGHSYEGKYREDDFALRVFGSSYPQTVVIAIADGVSSKEYSRWGAYAAVEGAISVSDASVTTLAQQVRDSLKGILPFEACERTANTVLLQSLGLAYKRIQTYAQEQNVSVNDLYSTLLVFFAVFVDSTHIFIGSVQIGDGALFVLRSEQDTTTPSQWQYLQHPQIQASGNEVQPFIRTTNTDWQQYIRYDWLDQPSFIMGMTDGVADDLEAPPTKDEPQVDTFLYVDEFRHAILKEAVSKPRPEKALVDFLGYQKKQSIDDRTVICLYREPGA